LLCDGHLNLDVQSAIEKRSLMKQGAITGISIGFQTVVDKIVDEEGVKVRHLKEIDLWEVSLCIFQACPGAVVTDVKSILEQKPYPNEHAARLQDPAKFDEFRRKSDGKLFNKIDVPGTVDQIWGHLKDGATDDWATQALRFPTKDWTVAEAKKWLADNEVKFVGFEPASKSIAGVHETIIGWTTDKSFSLNEEDLPLLAKARDDIDALLKAKGPIQGNASAQSIASLLPGLDEALRNFRHGIQSK
jgi:hypothetical protein